MLEYRLMSIRMFQISLPCWGALDESEALLHFTTECGSFSDCRFLHYNLPRARRIIRGAEYHRIAQDLLCDGFFYQFLPRVAQPERAYPP